MSCAFLWSPLRAERALARANCGWRCSRDTRGARGSRAVLAAAVEQGRRALWCVLFSSIIPVLRSARRRCSLATPRAGGGARTTSGRAAHATLGATDVGRRLAQAPRALGIRGPRLRAGCDSGFAALFAPRSARASLSLCLLFSTEWPYFLVIHKNPASERAKARFPESSGASRAHYCSSLPASEEQRGVTDRADRRGDRNDPAFDRCELAPIGGANTRPIDSGLMQTTRGGRVDPNFVALTCTSSSSHFGAVVWGSGRLLLLAAFARRSSLGVWRRFVRPVRRPARAAFSFRGPASAGRVRTPSWGNTAARTDTQIPPSP